MPNYRTASHDELKNGVPTGWTILWVARMERGFLSHREEILSGCLVYERHDEALADMARQLEFHGGAGAYAVVNHKTPDDKLECWLLEKKIR